MSAHKHKAITGVIRIPVSQLERAERYMWVLSMEVSKACDDYQMRVNGYKPRGLRGIINASVLKSQSENKNQ